MDTRRRRLTLVVIVLSNFCAVCCMSLIAPFFAIEATKKGVSLTVVGVIYSSSELVIFLSSPVFGYLLSTFSPRLFYIGGLCLFGCCDIIFGCLGTVTSTIPFIVACFFVRSIEALGTASVMTSSFTIAGICYPERIATVYGVLKSATGAALMIGPAIGGGFYEVGGHSQRIRDRVDGFARVAEPYTSSNLSPVSPTKRQSRFHVLGNPSVWFGILSIAVTFFGTGCALPFYAKHLTQFHLSQGIIGVIYMTAPAGFALSTPLWGYLLDKHLSETPTLWVGLCCVSVSFLLFGPAPFLGVVPMLWLSILTYSIIGLSFAPVSVSAMKSIYRGARDGGLEDDGATFGFLAGIIQSSTYIGTFSGPLLGGIIVDHFGFQWLMTACSILIMVTCLSFLPFLVITLWRKYRLRTANTGGYLELE
ncbi:MFS-type transporter SLC18B1-like [Haliotis asinina]|uniref:MFS-type transporter SLC18B1-like n=1 Tax=Haliotis asinina TaxID=109174 RepID=UPI0035327695